MTTNDSEVRSRTNTRARLLEAAAQVIADKGLAGASVDDLASAAGFTRGAFYSNYSSKEELLTDLFRSHSALMVDAARTALAQLPRTGFTQEMIGHVFAAIAPLGSIYFVIEHEYLLIANRDPAIRERFWRDTSELTTVIEDIITDVLGRLGREAIIPVQQLTFIVTATYMTWLSRMVVAGPHDEEFTFASDLVPTLLESFSRPLPSA